MILLQGMADNGEGLSFNVLPMCHRASLMLSNIKNFFVHIKIRSIKFEFLVKPVLRKRSKNCTRHNQDELMKLIVPDATSFS